MGLPSQDDLAALDTEALDGIAAMVVQARALAVKRNRAEAAREIEELARRYDLSLDIVLDQILGRVAKTEARELSRDPSYANPHNPSQTWAGKGRKPKWLTLLLESGVSLDSLLVKD